MPAMLFILFFILVLCLVVWPVQWAAGMMNARNTSFWRSLIALIAATILHSFGLLVPIAGSLVAFLLSAAGFAAILGTSYLRGISPNAICPLLSLTLKHKRSYIFTSSALIPISGAIASNGAGVSNSASIILP